MSKLEKVVIYIQLVVSSLFLFVLILSDFGLVFPNAMRTNVFARVIIHFSVIFLIASSVIQLSIKKRK